MFSSFPHSAATHSGRRRRNLGLGLFPRPGRNRPRFLLSEDRCCHALRVGKSKKIKAPGTGFTRPIRIRRAPNPLLNAACALCPAAVCGLGVDLNSRSCYWMPQRWTQQQLQQGCLWRPTFGCEAASKGRRPAAGHQCGPPSGRPSIVG